MAAPARFTDQAFSIRSNAVQSQSVCSGALWIEMGKRTGAALKSAEAGCLQGMSAGPELALSPHDNVPSCCTARKSTAEAVSRRPLVHVWDLTLKGQAEAPVGRGIVAE